MRDGGARTAPVEPIDELVSADRGTKAGGIGLQNNRISRRSLGMPTRPDTPPAPQAPDAPDGERCVQSNRRPRKNADEPRAGTSVCENRDRNAVIQQHRRDQPGYGAARAVIARQPAGAA